jgi:hypothetical protein
VSKKPDIVAVSVIPITDTNVAAPLNSGTEWSLMALGDLANCILRGTSIEETAEFLCRDVAEGRKPKSACRTLPTTSAGW